ncbi:MAG: hypothetical protein WCK53_11660, partial [Methanomicrobiales archaeon]
TWTQVTTNAGWQARFGQSAVALPDGSIILMGGANYPATAAFNDVWRSTDDGATWTEQVPGPVYPDIGTIAGIQLATAANGDWQNSSATVMVDAGDTNPSLAVVSLGNPGQVPAVTTHIVNLYPGQNGIVTSLLLPAQQNGLTSGPFPYTNAALKGLRAVQVDNLIYAFYTLDSNDLAVCTISITQGNVVNVLNTQKVTYSSAGNQMSTFNVQGSDNGIYLVSKQQGSQGSPVLDISLIPAGQLGSAGGSVINPQSIIQFQNSASFNPVPDNFLYSTLLVNDPTTGDPMVVGVSDYQGQVYSWYIDLSNPGTYGQAVIPITGPLPGSVALSQGSTSYSPTGVSNLVAVAFSPTGSPESFGGIYTIGPGQIGQPGSGWTTLYQQGTLGHPYFGSPGLSANNPMVFVPQGNGNMRQNMMFTSVQQAGGTATAWCSILGSNTLVPDPTPGNFDTQDNFNTYGNLSIPVGIIDGVPPIALNGYPCDDFPVNSEVDLISQGTSGTESSGSSEASGTVKYGQNFLDDKIGIGASYTYGAKSSTVNGTDFSATITREFPLYTQDWENSSSAWMVYLAPNFQTQHFWIYDYNGNPPAGGDAMNIYVTYPSQGAPYSSLLQGYSITNPPTSGPLGSAMQSPFYSDFSQWDWSSWSGGWMDRDWTQYAGSNSYTVTPIMGSTPLDFSNGASQSGTFDMTTNAGNTHESSNTVDADASIFGFGASGNVAFTQDQTVSNSIDKGIQFNWVLKDPAQGTCGYSSVTVEPVVITANPGSSMPLPWVPPAFRNYQPWLITYNLLSYDPSPSCGATAGLVQGKGVGIAVIPAGSGSVRSDPVNPQKGDLVHLVATPAPGYTFSHWQAYGVDLVDYSSAATEGRVKTQMSTVRAYFERQMSDLVTTARLTGGTPYNRIAISGTIPANLTKGVALDPKTPVKVIVGGKEFAFGGKGGPVRIVSDNLISFSTGNPPGSSSRLNLDYDRNFWKFAADNVDQMAKAIPTGHTVRIGLTAKNMAVLEDLPLPGSQSFESEGAGGLHENQLFSFEAGTMVIGSFIYPSQDPGRDTFIIEGARFNTTAFNPDQILRFTVNQLVFEFPNATARNGNQYSYVKSSKDCNASLVFDTGTGLWSATLDGQRLSNNYWGDTQVIGLQMGISSVQETITTGVSSQLSWPTGQSPLTAAFTGTPVQGASPLSVSFTDNSMGS